MNEKWLRINERAARASQLLGVGVSLDLHHFATANRLIVRQFGGELENSAFDLAHGASGYIISLCVTVNCPLIAIADFHLQLPWGRDRVQLLLPGTTSGRYSFPGRSPEFDRDDSINHLVELSKKFRKGAFFQGNLLVWSLDPIPADIMHGQQIPAFVAISDQYESKSIAPISLFVSRLQHASTHGNRGPLFLNRTSLATLKSERWGTNEKET